MYLQLPILKGRSLYSLEYKGSRNSNYPLKRTPSFVHILADKNQFFIHKLSLKLKMLYLEYDFQKANGELDDLI